MMCWTPRAIRAASSNWSSSALALSWLAAAVLAAVAASPCRYSSSCWGLQSVVTCNHVSNSNFTGMLADFRYLPDMSQSSYLQYACIHSKELQSLTLNMSA